MINNIIKRFYNLAKEHNWIRSFKYDRVSKGAGIGDELHPHFFLEDPIILGTAKTQDGKVKCSINFDILLTPQSLENYNIPQPSIELCQSIAHSIALNMVAKIRNDYELLTEGEYDDQMYDMEIIDFTFMTLRNWYDNKAAGVRCSINVWVKNDINFCDIDDHFDPNKEFKINNLLPTIDTDDAEGCTVFDYKLPTINFD